MATTTCTTCGKLYEESSEELANAPERDCMDCWTAKRTEENLRSYQDAVTGANPLETEKLNRALRHACKGSEMSANSYTVSLLEEVAELIQGYADVRDGSDGPRPNQAMIAANKLNKAIEFLKATSPSAITATGSKE